jgi:hypothetical protein
LGLDQDRAADIFFLTTARESFRAAANVRAIGYFLHAQKKGGKCIEKLGNRLTRPWIKYQFFDFLPIEQFNQQR